MRHFTVKQFAEACNGIFYGPSDILEKEIQGVVMDSRKVEQNYLFIATVGERMDGHRFIPDVYAKGAICAVSQQKLDQPEGPYIFVEDTLKALRDGAEAYRKTLDIPVVGITGSVGKTSTKEMIASVLSQKYQVLKTPGNFNNEIGLPLTIFMIDTCHEAAVLEMGMNHFGEMHRLSKMARPDYCVFTNIGNVHLEALGTRDGVFKAKTEMLDYAARDAKIIINGDDDKLIALKDRAITFGLDPSHQVWADQIENLGLNGIRCRIHTPDGPIDVTIPLPGAHMVYNAMAGTCTGLALDLDLVQIRNGIEAVKPIGGRNNIIRTARYTLMDDCYNASPTAMKGSLDTLNLTNTRKVAILGDMGELGTEQEALHASVGEHLKDLNIDLLITIGALSRAIHRAAESFAPQTRCLHYEDREQFLQDADSVLEDQDSILIKASHAQGFEQIVKALQEK